MKLGEDPLSYRTEKMNIENRINLSDERANKIIL
jgi:hypothetical protein